MQENISVIIPAYNEESSISLVLHDIPSEIVNEVVVVNNGSTDGTQKIAENLGATVLVEDKRGYGNACLKGIEYLETKPSENRPEILVFIDGDYSDYPEQISDLVKPIINDGYDLVIGSRTIGNRERGAMLPQAIFGNKIATFLIKYFYGVKFTDLGPFRAIKFDKLINLNMVDRTFGWTVEMQVKAAKLGYSCIEVPVDYRKRVGDSKISGTISGTVKAGYMILYTIFKYL